MSEAELEVRLERETVMMFGGEVVSEQALRIAYRPVGESRWRRFLVMPADGQTVEQLERYAEAMARLHYERAVGLVE